MKKNEIIYKNKNLNKLIKLANSEMESSDCSHTYKIEGDDCIYEVYCDKNISKYCHVNELIKDKNGNYLFGYQDGIGFEIENNNEENGTI